MSKAMKIIHVDSNKFALSKMQKDLPKIIPNAQLHCFQSPAPALAFAEAHGCDVLMTEVELWQERLGGIKLAKAIQKINLKKQFKVYVKAYKVINGKKVKLARSIIGHVVGVKNAKYTNVKTLKVTKSKLTVKVGKTAKVKAKVTLVNKNKKHIPKSHAAKFRYRTSNKKVATVTKSGKIKGIKKGTCTIYVYAINGKMKKVKVTVK